ncbi:endonuclease III [Geoglobus acetivorans]|uniref:Endonuclease III n=1 Tax=Geoglobus acetivorans TaxID=565033 RepID=A0ABZ3H328_GEOAI|nr:endonuclease III [Geoglobus acetivorans]
MSIDRILDVMEDEAKRRNAPVYTLKERTSDPFKVLISAILSTRTRDEQTVSVADRLFQRVSDFSDLKNMEIRELEDLLKGVGFYRNKAKILKKLAEELDGKEIPSTLEGLLKLPGVGRKVANIVLSEVFGVETIAVDTHVHRIANRIGIVETKTPEETEIELKKRIPEKLWRKVNRAFVGYGQTVCKPLRPLCDECRISIHCRYYRKEKNISPRAD